MRDIIIILVILFVLHVTFKKVKEYQDEKNLLLSVGFPPDRINLFLAQLAFETGGFNSDSNVAKTNNNLTGITFINKAYQKNAIKGLPMPKSDGAGFYANFKTLKDWAVDYKRILSLNTGKLGKPIDAPNVAEFVKRLKANGYFGGKETVYLAGLNSWIKKIV